MHDLLILLNIEFLLKKHIIVIIIIIIIIICLLKKNMQTCHVAFHGHPQLHVSRHKKMK